MSGTQLQVAIDFNVSQHAPALYRLRQVRQHLRSQRHSGEGLLLLDVELGDLQGQTTSPIKLSRRQKVMGGFISIGVFHTLAATTHQPKRPRSPAPRPLRLFRAAGRQCLGRPAMHPKSALHWADQRQTHQALQPLRHHRPVRRRHRCPVQRPGQLRRAHRQAGHRQLPQRLFIALLAGQRQQLIQQHGARAQQRGVAQGFTQAGGGFQINSCRLGFCFQAAPHLRQAAHAVAQQGIQKLQHARVAAHMAHHVGQVGALQPFERLQPPQQLAHLGCRKRRHRQIQQLRLHTRHRVTAGDEQAARLGALRQPRQQLGGGVFLKTLAARVEVVFKVIQHQQQPGLLEQAAQQAHTGWVIQPHVAQRLRGLRPTRVGVLPQGQRHRRTQRPQRQTALHCRHGPAVFLQTRHHPARHRAFAHAANAGEHHTAQAAMLGHAGGVISQHTQHAAQLPPTAHQVAQAQIRHRAGGLMHWRLGQGLARQGKVHQRRILARTVQRGGGVFSRVALGFFTALQGLLAPVLQRLARRGQRLRGLGELPLGQGGIKRMGQLGGVGVRHTGLHGHHKGHARLHQLHRHGAGLRIRRGPKAAR